MKKPPKFLLCRNEMAAPGRVWVLHTQNPKFMAEIRDYDPRDESNDVHVFVHGQSFTLSIVEMCDDVEIKEPLIDRLRDWVHSYVKNEQL